METIRCPRCQKLLRADARSCSRCGIAIPAGRASRKRNVSQVDLSHPTSPLASPHRAGHYSGLHPEDQPFQSSFFLQVRRPPEFEPDVSDASTVLDLSPDSPDPEPDVSDASTVLDLLPDPPTYPARPPRGLEGAEEDEDAAYSPLADLPTLAPRHAPNTPLPETLLPEPPRRSINGPRLVRLLITGSLICFLLGTGLLTFLLLSKNQGQAQAGPPRLLAQPGEVRVGDLFQLTGSGFEANRVVALTRDAGTKILDARGQQVMPTTDGQGTFQIHVPVTPAWNIGVHTLQASSGQTRLTTSLTIQATQAGPPLLQLGNSRVDLGSGNPGTVVEKTVTLTNAGGGRVTWSAQSSTPWLALSPTSGSFAGSTLVTLRANRSNLAPGAYLGQITFTQGQGQPQTLHVSMTVNIAPAGLVLSTASLSFAGTPAQSPAGQTIVIQNSGGQTLDWSAASTTASGGDWLSVTPTSGSLPPSSSAILTVNVVTVNMDLGAYQGALSFSYAGGQVQQIAIALNVNPPPQPALHLSPQSLSFTSNQGIDPKPQSFTISNPGNAPLNWAMRPDASGQTYLNFSASSGSVPPGQSATVTVAPALGSANGTITSTLTIIDTDHGTNVPPQKVSVSIAITNQPVITPAQTTLVFDHDGRIDNTTTLLVFKNSGSLPLNWSLMSSQAPWLSFDVTSGTLAPGQSMAINVGCASRGMAAGTYTVTLTLKDTDAGTVVVARSIRVTLIISA